MILKKKKNYALNRESTSYLMLTPFLLLFSIFTLIPVIATVVISFTNYNVLETPQFVGWQNYINLFVHDDIFMKSISNTLVYAVITGPVGYILAFVVAWILNEMQSTIRAIMTFIVYVPSISGTAFIIWKLIFDGDVYGYANSFLMGFGFVEEPIQWLTTEQYILPIIIIVQLWMSMGAGFLAMRAGFSSVDASLYEAAAVDGIKNRFQELFYITVPAMGPHLMTAAVLQITSMFANSAVSESLVGSPSTNYAGHLIIQHLNDYSSVRFQRGYAAAISVILFVMMIFMNKLVLRLLDKVGR
ncbi:MAG: sugar ABC transporter permease [Clostridia bacterium]|nr:sugar ABC transporter permease [Clostridia bacterium]